MVACEEQPMAVKPIPDTYTAVTPYLIVKDCDKLLEFMKAAFDARITDVHRDPGGRVVHADVTIGGAHIMMGQAGGKWPEKLGSIHLYVPDSDAAYKAAVAAGAKSVYEVTNHFYGDRSGGVEDPCGVTWWISTHVEDVSPEEMERRMKTGQPG
jgi:PhnB protein